MEVAARGRWCNCASDKGNAAHFGIAEVSAAAAHAVDVGIPEAPLNRDSLVSADEQRLSVVGTWTLMDAAHIIFIACVACRFEVSKAGTINPCSTSSPRKVTLEGKLVRGSSRKAASCLLEFVIRA